MICQIGKCYWSTAYKSANIGL